MSLESDLFLHGVALPAGIAASAAVSARMLPSSLRPPWRAGGVAVAYGAAHVLISGWPRFPPRDVADWLPFAAVAGVLFACVQPRLSGRRAFPLLLGLVIATVWLILGKLAGRLWTRTEAALWFAGCGGSLLLLWAPLGLRRPAPRTLPLLLAMTALSAATCVMLAFSARYAAFAVALASATAPSALRALRRPNPDGLRAEAAPGHLILGCLLLLMLHYAEVRPSIVALLAASWVVALLGERWMAATAANSRRAALRVILLAAIPALAALALAVATRLDKPEDPYAQFR